MKKIVVLSSDTYHHRYFLQTILMAGIPLQGTLFETKHLQASFPTGPLFESQQDSFEAEHFFGGIPYELPRGFVLEVDSVNSPDAVEKIAALKPDFGVVFGTGKISKDVIRMFPDGLINVHRGIAEEYRGLDSDLWAIYHNDYKNIGVTIHKVELTLDTGDVVLQKKMELRRSMQAHEIRYYTSLIATDLVIQALKNYLSGILKYRPQKKRGRYYSFMPLDLKKIVTVKFKNYCENLDF